MTATAVVDRVHLGDHVCWAHDDDRAALDSYVQLGCVLCPYDAARLDPVVLAEARCTTRVHTTAAGTTVRLYMLRGALA